jgi:hypothetical protein
MTMNDVTRLQANLIRWEAILKETDSELEALDEAFYELEEKVKQAKADRAWIAEKLARTQAEMAAALKANGINKDAA